MRAFTPWLCAAGLSLSAAATSAPLDGDDVAQLCARFSGFDQDGDGEPELLTVTHRRTVGASGPRVAVLVEARLAEAPFDAELTPRIDRLAEDLAREGRQVDVIEVRVEAGARHQDGLDLLALRELLRALDRGARRSSSQLEGCLLIGRFPDALLVRTCNWRRKGDLALRQGQADARAWQDVPYLRRVPEDVARRADIVLADLDGHWEDLYVQPRTRLATQLAVFPDGVPEHGGPCADLELGAVTFEDFFHVSDGKLEVEERVVADGAPAAWSVRLFDRAGDHESSAADRVQPNVLARPDLFVSRIDARGTARAPRKDVQGVDGERLLDDQGQPRAARFASRAAAPDWRKLDVYDEGLELQLLAEYFDRNHAYRAGNAEVGWRATSLACELPSGFALVQRAASDFDPSPDPRADIQGTPTLLGALDWFAYPAALRTLRAHSDDWGSAFAQTDTAALDARLGGPAWAWTKVEDQLVPSLRAACQGGKLDWYLLRSLWAYGQIAGDASLYLHTGCNAISPPGALDRRFDDPRYGARQGAEALLFFGRGVALIGRAKVFYDEPRGFVDVLREGGHVGAAWARYFTLEGAAERWQDVGGDIGRKRAYFWSVLGDWSLTLAMARPRSSDGAAQGGSH
ncbi:MAG: hypothetical protein R3F49_13565 [Planctomycetota bacterium]